MTATAPTILGRVWRLALERDLLLALRMRESGRSDDDFPWSWYERMVRPAAATGWRLAMANLRCRARRLLPGHSGAIRWLRANEEALWRTRDALADEASRQAFDMHLKLLLVGPWRVRHRPQLEAPVEMLGRRAFVDSELAADYMGLALEWFRLRLIGSNGELEVLTTDLQFRLFERFGQYFPDGAARVCRARAGDIVFDCGSCVGDMSLLYAALVGASGRVFAFDPVPLHHRYLERQLAANPSLHGRVVSVSSAVGDSTCDPPQVQELGRQQAIHAGFRADSRTRFIRLDDFITAWGLDHVDLVKMDIEGSEPAALRGAADLIRRHRPRLVISAYHDRGHLIELPRLIRELEPNYRFGFAQHSPVHWEGVLYAWCDARDGRPNERNTDREPASSVVHG